MISTRNQSERCLRSKVSKEDLLARSVWETSAKDTTGDLVARPLYKACVAKIPRQNLCSNSLLQSACGRSLCQDAAEDLVARSLYKVSRSEISRQDLCKTSLYKKTFGMIPTDVHARSQLYKISRRGLLARSLNKVSTRHRSTRSLHKLSIKDLLVKISAQDLLDHQHEHRAVARAI